MTGYLFSERSSRSLINIFFAYLTCATCFAGWWVSQHIRQWIVSDWLINYEGGFVRRGLPGQTAYIIGTLFHVPPATIVAVFFISLFLWFLFSVFQLAWRSSMNIWVLALLLSPATFSAQLLNPQAGFHKEILFLASLAAFLVWLQKNPRASTEATVLLSVFAVLAVLSHESLIFYLPYFFAAFLLSDRTVSYALRYLALPAAIAVSTAFMCSRHLGSEAVATHICNSLGYSFPSNHPNGICDGGAILYLTRSPSFARQEVLAMVRQNHYWKLRTLPIPILLALIPALGESFLLARTRRSRAVWIIWSGAALSLLFSMVLFIYAIDWGRWIWIHFVSITVCLLYADSQRATNPELLHEPGISAGPAQKVIAGMLLFLYATVWSLPNDAKTTALFGYAGRAYAATHRQPKGTQSIEAAPRPL
jgi:hypothetical protein